MKMVELKAVCVGFNLKTTGTKQALIDRLMDYKLNGVQVAPRSKKTAFKDLKKTKKINCKVITPPDELEFEYDDVSGMNYNRKTGLIINEDNVAVLCKDEDGMPVSLTSRALEYCKEYHIEYIM